MASEIEFLIFYEELNDEGKFFVDYWTEKILDEFKFRFPTKQLGIKSARELALSLLAHTWNGELPEGFPALGCEQVEVSNAV